MIAVLGRTFGRFFGHGDALERLLTMGGSRALAAALGFLATILIARSLSPAGLGLWSMALAVQGLALHIGEAGLRTIATSECARRPALARAYLVRTLELRLAISTLCILASWLVIWQLQLEGGWLVGLLLTSLWPIALQLDWLPLALGRNRQAAALLLVRPTAFIALLLAVPLVGEPSRLAWLFLGAWWLAAMATWPCLRLVHRTKGSEKHALSSRRLLRLALPVAAVTLMSQLLLSLDLLLVGWRFGAEAAGQYFLASAVLVAGLVAANGLGQAGLARLSARAGDAGAFCAALALDMQLLLGIGLIAAFTAAGLAPWLLPLAFGGDYAPAASLVLWLLPWFVLQHATTMLQSAMTAARLGDRLLMVNLALVATLVPALAVAWQLQDIRAFALARGLAELVRVAGLYCSLPPSLQPFRSGRRA